MVASFFDPWEDRLLRHLRRALLDSTYVAITVMKSRRKGSLPQLPEVEVINRPTEVACIAASARYLRALSCVATSHEAEKAQSISAGERMSVRPKPKDVMSSTVRVSDPRVESAPAANEMGGADGMVAAQAIALVLLSRYVPALYGALTLANLGMYGLAGAEFFEAMASDAYGSAWPWRGRAAYAEKTRDARRAYIDGFTASFGRALESGTTPDQAIQDLVTVVNVPVSAPVGSERIFAWIAAMDRLGQRAWADQEGLLAERAAHRARGLPCGWILPAPRAMGWLARRSVGREYATRVESTPGGYVATVQSLVIGRVVYRACFASRSDAEREAAAFISVRWQIAHLPHLRGLDKAFDSAAFEEPFGEGALASLLRGADSFDRHARGMGLGVFNDSDTWEKILAGNVAGLLTRLPTLPFQWSRPILASSDPPGAADKQPASAPKP